jgi:CheY-like chemotaxis protein
VEEARNGAEGVERARIRPPDLILLDLEMPVLDGQAAMRVLAADPVTARVPVLTLSAQTIATSDDGPGMQTFLPKPVDPDRLLALIRTALRNSPALASPDRRQKGPSEPWP